jgi:hypothetical protein
MDATTKPPPAGRPALRRLMLLPTGGRRPLDRDEALRQIRGAIRHVQPREERFAHLKRAHD